MEERIRDLLRSMAGEVPPHTELPPATLARSRRAMGTSALAMALVVALAGTAAYAGVRALTSPPSRTPVGSPPPTARARTCDWARVTSPNQDPSTLTNRLEAVAAAGDDDVWAVGGSYVAAGEASGPEQPLVLHWDGIDWSIVDMPGLEPGFGLSGLAATAWNDVWAVGSEGTEGGGDRPLTLHWDGATWSVVPTPDPGKAYGHLRAVAAISPSDVWAVGNWATGHGEAGTLAMHWDGRDWAIIPSPDVPPRPQVGWSYPGLDAVTGLAADDVWAIGTSDNVAPAGPSNTLAVHWDGSGWSAVSTPDLPASSGLPYDRLAAVHGISPGDVWAVGSYGQGQEDDPDSSLPEAALAERWDGSNWSVTGTPGLDGRSAFEGVTALSTTEAWAVGWHGPEGWPGTALIERWDGAAWNVVPAPVDQDSWLSAVTATPSGHLWAVGSAELEGGTWGTLVLHAAC